MFTLTINTENAAFDDPTREIARLLRAAALRVEMGKLAGRLVDINGNVVGSFTDGTNL